MWRRHFPAVIFWAFSGCNVDQQTNVNWSRTGYENITKIENLIIFDSRNSNLTEHLFWVLKPKNYSNFRRVYWKNLCRYEIFPHPGRFACYVWACIFADSRQVCMHYVELLSWYVYAFKQTLWKPLLLLLTIDSCQREGCCCWAVVFCCVCVCVGPQHMVLWTGVIARL